MKPVKATAQILAFKAINRDIDKEWVNWAVDMLLAGFNTENLVILAGETEPFNQFELQKLTDKVLTELQLSYADKIEAIESYACYLVEKALNKELLSIDVLKILKDLCLELDYESNLFHFLELYYAKDDLLYSDMLCRWSEPGKY